jgi:hypothetical protein
MKDYSDRLLALTSADQCAHPKARTIILSTIGRILPALFEASGEDVLQILGEAVGSNRSTAVGNIPIRSNKNSAGRGCMIDAAKGAVRILENGKAVERREIGRRGCIDNCVRVDVLSISRSD